MFRRLHLESLEPRHLLAVVSVGPYVGGVTSTSAKVFVRTDVAATVQIEYSTSADFTGSQITTSTATSSTSDFTSTTTLVGLQAETKYFYRILLNGQVATAATVSSFTTFAPPGAQREITFAVTADLRNAATNPTAPAPTYASIAAADPDFVLQIGDFDHRNPTSLSAMRRMHRDVLSDRTAAGADFATYIAPRFPFFHVFDDHDYGQDDGNKTFAGRSAALQAFREYYGPSPLANPAAGVWQSFADGQVDVFMLDLRSQRDPNTQPDGPSKSMLDGDNIANGQKAWLKSGLLNSSATWKFLISSVAFNPTTKPYDSWGAFATERNEILDFIHDNHITGIVVVSGDLHSGGAIDDGTNSGLPEISVPHINLEEPPTEPTSGIPGDWSEGLLTGSDNPGYGLIRVQSNPARAVLEVHGADGSLRKSYIVSLPSGADSIGPGVSMLNVGPSTTTYPPRISAELSDFASGASAIAAAEYFIDTLGAPGGGFSLSAVDAQFDSPREDVAATLSRSAFNSLSTGAHTVYVRGRDALGNWGPAASATLTKITTPRTFFVSTATSGTLTNSDGSTLSASNADILELTTPADGSFRYQLFLDGSDVGLGAGSEDVDAFTLLADGSIVLSTRGAFSLQTSYVAGMPNGPLITGGGNDLLRFLPTSLGSDTSGSWTAYVRGADVGLSGSAENIDAVSVLPDGRVVISTTGNIVVPGVSGKHNDLLRYDRTANKWAMLFDGSDVAGGRSDDDIDALFIEPTGAALPILHFSFRGAAYAPGESARKFTPTRLGGNTTGTYGAVTFDGAKYGLSSFGLDGVWIGEVPFATAAAQTIAAEAAVSQEFETVGRSLSANAIRPQGVQGLDEAAAGQASATPETSTEASGFDLRMPATTAQLLIPSESINALITSVVRKPAREAAADAALLAWPVVCLPISA